jgi:small subunit ribosomal protein S3
MIKIGGKISGERARSQKFMYGSIKYSGEPARSGMANGFSAAKLKQGIIGVNVRILKNDYRLPDDIKIPDKIIRAVKEEKDGNKGETTENNE